MTFFSFHSKWPFSQSISCHGVSPMQEVASIIAHLYACVLCKVFRIQMLCISYTFYTATYTHWASKELMSFHFFEILSRSPSQSFPLAHQCSSINASTVLAVLFWHWNRNRNDAVADDIVTPVGPSNHWYQFAIGDRKSDSYQMTSLTVQHSR